ncbi:aryl hydrocarbon receptor nuclear translocator-like [Notechis scutatus]|uniref:Aryl hydrocarbon receptor nuclear translocator-like n=1 Tax=Notechis scutatus TaxID=8663 RepID=A0A6J1W6R1_9SAUR|nr:aryl hydrocarbon receptor nuclear translocator-like [Notechis scutatus]
MGARVASGHRPLGPAPAGLARHRHLGPGASEGRRSPGGGAPACVAMATAAAEQEMASDVSPLGAASGTPGPAAGSLSQRSSKRRTGLEFDDDGEGNSKFLRCEDDQLSTDKERFAR